MIKRALRILLLFALVTVLGLGLWARYGPKPKPAPAPVVVSQETPSEAPEVRPGRDSRPPEAHLVTAAKGSMRNPSEGSCGPYRRVSDVRQQQLLEICERVAAPLEGAFRRRFGLEPRGVPREGVFLFESRKAFQSFAQKDGRLRAGYAGYANGAKGFVAIPAGSLDPEIFATTLAHELTHLLLRRAMGPGLPPWLSEGLADAMGDPATPAGLGELTGFAGVEGQARRLRDAYRGGVAASVQSIVSRRRSEFDQGALSFDYEQSALLVRFLLLHPALGPRFRSFLEDIAGASIHDPEQLPQALGKSWSQLDGEFRAWVLASG
ncbi:MAG: hypothetical protein K0U98_08485 [Deltaproteobacteria bacterium]|nr:hypothetical protein [Deltaproteobacteria bacterium]